MATVRYLVLDIERSVEFYSTLGFVVKEKWGPAIAIMGRGDLELWVSGPLASASKPMPDGRVPGPGGWNRFVISVESISTVVEKLKADGATFRNEILVGPGGSQILLEDPDGNPIELFEPRR